MRALTEITTGGPQQSYVNALTHMAQRRALNLFSGGAPVDSATALAEAEVRGVFAGLAAPASLAPGVDLNLFGGDNPSNAYLLALSCHVSQAALNASDGTDFDAQLQQLMNTIAADLEADGIVDPVFIEQKIDQASTFDPYECVASLQKRLDDIGDVSTVLPNPLGAVDWDRDGIPNSTDPDVDGDGVDAASDPVISLAVVQGGSQLVVVKRDQGHALQLLGEPPPPAVGVRYSPSLVADAGGALTDVVEAVAALGEIVIRRGDGTVHHLPRVDTYPEAVAGIASGAVAITVTMDNSLLVIDDNGNVTRHNTFDPSGPPISLPMSDVTRVAGFDDYWVYLDSGGGVHIDGIIVADVAGLGGINIIDVAAEFGTFEALYMAISDTGVLYRFSGSAPTAVEDTSITGISSLHVSGGTLFAITGAGVWNLSEGAGPFQVSDVAGLTSFYGPVTWGESGISAYVATDTGGNVQLIHFTGDLSINSLFRQVYVPG
jgi:hypothetical protein